LDRKEDISGNIRSKGLAAVNITKVLEDEIVKGLDKLIRYIWAKGSCFLFILEEQYEDEKVVTQNEVKRDIPEEIKDKIISSLINQELPEIKQSLPSLIERNSLAQPYEIPTSGIRIDNPSSELNAKNYILPNPIHPYTQHLCQPLRPPRPIFKNCAIHAAIAYFIDVTNKREAYFFYYH